MPQTLGPDNSTPSHSGRDDNRIGNVVFHTDLAEWHLDKKGAVLAAVSALVEGSTSRDSRSS